MDYLDSMVDALTLLEWSPKYRLQDFYGSDFSLSRLAHLCELMHGRY